MTTTLIVGGNSAGSMNGDGSRKILLHSTEGSSWQGAVAAYRANNSWPHRTVDARIQTVVKHLDLRIAGRALRNEAGGEETNREGSILVQYELVGFAAVPGIGWTLEEWQWFGREVLGPDAREVGVPLETYVQWVAYPGSYGEGAAQRLSYAAWDAYNGVLAHQHAPENSHGDPGLIPIQVALAAAKGTPEPPPEEEIPDMLLVQGPNGIALCAPGFWRNLSSMAAVAALQASGVPGPKKKLDQAGWDTVKHNMLNPSHDAYDEADNEA